MQDDGAVRGAAHARVTDPHHVAYALLQQLGGQRQVADLGHAGIALGPAAAQDQHGGLVHVEVGRVEPGVHVLDAVEDDGPAAVAQQFGRGGGGLDHGAGGGEVAAQDGDAGVGQQGVRAAADDVLVPDLGVGEVLDERPSCDGDRGGVEQVLDLLEQGGQAARPEQVVHQVASGRLQVRQQRHA